MGLRRSLYKTPAQLRSMVEPGLITAAALDAVRAMIAPGVTTAELERALTKIRSGLYDLAGSPTRFGLTTLLASFALFDDDPARINELEAQFRKVTPADLAATAREYLRPGNRTELSLKAGAATVSAP